MAASEKHSQTVKGKVKQRENGGLLSRFSLSTFVTIVRSNGSDATFIRIVSGIQWSAPNPGSGIQTPR